MKNSQSLTVAIITLSVALASPVRAQKQGTWNSALIQSAVDPAALGTAQRGFLEYSIYGRDIDWVASAGVALAGGALRASYGTGFDRHLYGLGYARTLAQKDVAPLVGLAAGMDLSAAYLDNKFAPYSARGARVSVPFSVRLGWPSWLSATPYVAPYAEAGRDFLTHGCDAIGRCTSPVTANIGATHALGMGAGVQVTAWRLGLELGTRDLLSQKKLWTGDQVTLSLRWRF
ncbi:MAG: hypothetical protein ACJ796_22235 [Gemmatimonadaceae bacterium]